MLEDSQDIMIIYCDNFSIISFSKNLVQHSRTKPIDIRPHFVRDLVESKIIFLVYIPIQHQLADLFTKPLNVLFEFLKKAISVGNIK